MHPSKNDFHRNKVFLTEKLDNNLQLTSAYILHHVNVYHVWYHARSASCVSCVFKSC